MLFGLVFAKRQLDAWRDEALIRKRAEVAENLLAVALTVSDELKALRSPFDSVPVDQANNRKYVHERRLQRFLDKKDLFLKLREAQIQAEAVIDNPDINKAVDTLFNVRNQSMNAIDMLSEEPENIREDDEENRKFYRRLRRDMYGIYTEKHDPLGMEQLAAIDTLKRLLRPHIVMQQA